MTTYSRTKIGEAWEQGGKDDESRLVETYLVSDSSPITVSAAEAVASMQSADELPQVGEAWTTWATTSLRATLRCRSVSGEHVPGSGGKLKVTVLYSTRYTWEYEGTTPLNKAVLRWRKQISARIRPMQIHRALTDCSSAGTSGDIGGTKVDPGGRPLTVQVPQNDIVLWRYVDSTQESLSTIDDNLSTYIGRLNSATFIGWSAGLLLCQAAELVHDRDEYWIVRYMLTYDRFLHYEQRPDCAEDGFLKRTTDGKASTVRWSRDYSTADFNNIIQATDTAYHKHRAQKGEYVYTV